MAKKQKSKSKIQDSLTGLNEKLVFARFGQLARQRESLYNDFIEIDEPDEIGRAWVGFGGNVVSDLMSVIDLTKSLFERIIDELRRNKDANEEKNLDRIKNLTEFWLDLSIMSYLYATIEKRGVLNQPGINKPSQGYADTKKSIDDLIILAFQTGNDFFNLDARLTLGEVLSLNQEKRMLDYFDSLGEATDEKYQLLGQYDQQQAGFLMTRVKQSLIESAKTWWWSDAIGIHSSSEHAISHIDSMIANWRHCTSDVQERGQVFYNATFPIARISSDVALAQHYRRLAVAALRARANTTSSEYFSKAAKLTSSLGVENLGLIDNLDLWKRSIPQQYLLYDQMSHLSAISSKYQSILRYLGESKTDEVLILLPEILEKLETMLSQGDLAYVSSVAIAYETVFTYIEEELNKKTDVQSILTFVTKRINIIAERLHKASHQVTENWVKVVNKAPIDLVSLSEVVNNIDLPLMASLILPPDQKLVNEISSELLAVENATEALIISSLADKEFGTNPVKEMLMRAKIYQLTHRAQVCLVGMADEVTSKSIKLVLEPLANNALLRGLIAEVQLRTSVLQFRFINTIAPLIENSSLSSKKIDLTPVQDEEELTSFEESLKELNLASIAIQDHKAPINIGGAPLNWNYINKLQYYSEGLIEIITAVKSAIKASSKEMEIEDRITMWDEAKSTCYKAADTVAKARSQDSENLAQQVYSLAQVFAGFENNERSRKAQGDFPVDGVVELLQALIMGI